MAVATIEQQPLLALHGVSKRFGGVRALDHVDFDLKAGEIHALLGENGAGKSTLIKILGGIYTPDAGSLFLDGQPASIRNVSDANRCGIRLIHQELSLAPNLSIAANLFLGREPTRFGLLDHRRMEAAAEDVAARLGLSELQGVWRQVGTLSVAHRQLVEIARALSGSARILVLDEPTSSLSDAETEALFATLHRLRKQGVGMIYISHRLEEIVRLADRITVLRDGRSIGTQSASGVNQGELVRWMVGREIAEHFPRPRQQPQAVALDARHLTNEAVHDVSLEVRYGEILGIAGLVGSGRSELACALFGIDRLQKGEIYIDGRPVAIRNPRQALDAGLLLVPEDRKQQGLIMEQSSAFNLALPWVARWINGPVVHRRRRREIVDRAIRQFKIRLADAEEPIQSLSGGNQQKALVGRWMEERPKILILDEPTRGVDVGAREEMFRIVGQLVEEGMAIVFISSDLAEVLHMAHRVALYRQGRIQEIVPAESITLEDIMRRLTGAEVS